MLLIPFDLDQCLRTLVESTYPEEGCGLLLGKFTETDGIAIALLETENAYQGDRKKHFEIAPKVMLQSQKSARERDLEIIGVYHSHPDHPAVPSVTDRQLAWPQYFYLIVAVDSGKAIELRAWRLDDEGNFQEESIESIDLRQKSKISRSCQNSGVRSQEERIIVNEFTSGKNSTIA